MLIKLVQDNIEGKPRIVDIASSINRLDFSGLLGSGDWRVYVIWDNRQECIAHVIWESSMTYQIHVQCNGVSHPAQIIGRRDTIVPTVKHCLEQLFQKTAINQIYKCQSMVVVQPDMGVA